MFTKNVFHLLVAGVIGGLVAAPAFSQDYPNRPIKVIVSNAPGGAPDLVIRSIIPEMTKILGQPLVVENKTGANSVLGYEFVAKHVPPDGYTLGMATVPTLASLPVAVKNLTFDPLKDFPPIIDIADGRLALFSAKSAPWKSFDEMISLTKANPGKYTYGASVFLTRIISEAVIRDRGVNVLAVNYADSGKLSAGVLSSEVNMAILSFPSVIALGDNVRTIAVTGDKRDTKHPEIPTFKELGLGQINSTGFSLNAPAGVPKAIIDKLYAAASQSLKDPEVIARLEKLGFEVADQSPAISAKRLSDEAALFADIAKKANIQPE